MILDQNADIDTYIVAADAVAVVDPSFGCVHGMDGTDYFLLLLFLFLFHHPLRTMSTMALTWDTAVVVAAAVIGGDDDDIVAVVEYDYW